MLNVAIRATMLVIMYSFVTCVCAQNDMNKSTADNENDVTLYDMLTYGLEMDVDISGGYGASRDDPIIVNSPDKLDASLTEMMVLRGIGKIQDVLWRSVSKEQIINDKIILEKIKIHAKSIGEDEILNRTSNYYFDVSRSGEAGKALPAALIYSDANSGIVLPYEIGWAHYDSVIDNEPDSPGFGQSIAYGAPGMKVTVYVYDRKMKKIPEDVESLAIRNEFERSVSDMEAYTPDIKELSDVIATQDMVYQAFDTGEYYSVLSLSSARNKFIKLRLSHLKHPIFGDPAEQTLEAFQEVVKINKKNNQ